MAKLHNRVMKETRHEIHSALPLIYIENKIIHSQGNITDFFIDTFISKGIYQIQNSKCLWEMRLGLGLGVWVGDEGNGKKQI